MERTLCPHCQYYPANPRYHGYCSDDCEEHAEVPVVPHPAEAVTT